MMRALNLTQISVKASQIQYRLGFDTLQLYTPKTHDSWSRIWIADETMLSILKDISK